MPTAKLDPVAQGGRVRSASATLTYATQAAGTQAFDTPLELPNGAVIVGGVITTSVTTGSATVALGITGTVAKYKAAAAVTAVTAASLAIPDAAVLTALTAKESVFPTTASAALPASGTLKVVLFYVVD